MAPNRFPIPETPATEAKTVRALGIERGTGLGEGRRDWTEAIGGIWCWGPREGFKVIYISKKVFSFFSRGEGASFGSQVQVVVFRRRSQLGGQARTVSMSGPPPTAVFLFTSDVAGFALRSAYGSVIVI